MLNMTLKTQNDKSKKKEISTILLETNKYFLIKNLRKILKLKSMPPTQPTTIGLKSKSINCEGNTKNKSKNEMITGVVHQNQAVHQVQTNQ